MTKTFWIYASDPDNAIELAWECREYSTLDEALRKGARHQGMTLFEVVVRTVGISR